LESPLIKVQANDLEPRNSKRTWNANGAVSGRPAGNGAFAFYGANSMNEFQQVIEDQKLVGAFEILVEELEQKIAPDGGETVLPL
jgi:hypothetical protein